MNNEVWVLTTNYKDPINYIGILFIALFWVYLYIGLKNIINDNYCGEKTKKLATGGFLLVSALAILLIILGPNGDYTYNVRIQQATLYENTYPLYKIENQKVNVTGKELTKEDIVRKAFKKTTATRIDTGEKVFLYDIHEIMNIKFSDKKINNKE